MEDTVKEPVNEEVPLADNGKNASIPSEEMTDEEWRLYWEDYNLLSCHDSFS